MDVICYIKDTCECNMLHIVGHWKYGIRIGYIQKLCIDIKNLELGFSLKL